MDDTLEAVSVVIPVAVALLTIAPAWSLINSFRSKPIPEEALYKDKDGVASEDSMTTYKSRRPFIPVFIGCALGLAASFALAVFATVKKHHFGLIPIIWLLSASWASLLYA